MHKTKASFPDVQDRALSSEGQSNSPVLYELVKETILGRKANPHTLIDVGCGRGNLFDYLESEVDRYIGIDVVRHASPPRKKMEFHAIDMDLGRTSLADNTADVVCSIETIEHVENPRAFLREMVRLAKPGGLIIVTTPNQLSFLSKLCFVVKNEFVHFQEKPGLYPAHLSALLEVDLLRLGKENSLKNLEIKYSGEGRIPGTAAHWPKFFGGRLFSDNVVLIGEK
jgi:2-polyprenyl-3-methyl-5-hydroxy-6-metoxy-1,4-benzoquinol methylase